MAMKHEKTIANISNECHWSRDGKIDTVFFFLLLGGRGIVLAQI